MFTLTNAHDSSSNLSISSNLGDLDGSDDDREFVPGDREA